MTSNRPLVSQSDLVDALPDAVVGTDIDGRIVLVNNQAERLFGYPRAALLGRPIETLVPERLATPHRRHRTAYAADPRTRPMGVGIDLRARHADGSEFPVEISLSPVETNEGRVVLAAIRDVTDQRRSEQRFRALLESAPDAMIITNAEGRITLVNSRTEKLFGHPRSRLLGGLVDMLVPARHRSGHVAHRNAYVASPRTRPMGAGLELSGLRADGSEFPVEISLSPLQTDEGVFTITAIRDLSERRRAEEVSRHARRQAQVAELGRLALAEHDTAGVLEEAVRVVSSALDVPIAMVLELEPDADEVIVRAGLGFPPGVVGRATVPLGGTQAGSTIEHGPLVVSDLKADARLEADALLRDHGVVSGVTVPMALGDVRIGVLGAHATTSRSFSEEDVNFLESVANILAAAIARQRTEAALAESRRRLEAVLDNTPAAIYLKDLGGRYLLGNAQFGRIMGVRVEEALGQTDDQLLPAALAAAVRANDDAVVSSRRPLEFTETIVVGSTERVFQSLKFPVVDDSGAPYGLGGVSLDVTDRFTSERERERLEARLRRAERLESVGQLAGGIAHDFNNLLAVVANYAGFLSAELPPGTQLAEDVQQIVQATQQASELTRRLLQFSRRQPGHPEVLDLTEVLTEIERLLARTLGEHIVVRTACDDGLWRVTADRGQLEQVLMNLALNARDAMPDGGELRMTAHNARLDEAEAPVAGDGPRAGDFVKLTVADTGTGMSREVADRVFEPFFTTKPSGQGTGLGLPSVYGIVAQAGGWLDLETAPGRGTSVTAWLPGTDAHPVSRPSADDERARGQGELVLVVEDQPGVREVTRRILSSSGYEVVEADAGAEALRVIEAEHLTPALLVTDVLMPGLSGPELVARLRERMPGLPVIFVSGFMEEAVATGAADTGPTLFVEKPFSAARLLQAVGEALQTG